ncbi:cold shock domain-containing protein [Microtetraspora malaysiensis]|uniref:cold shock domain-containing protein n=1 Tax=Microtetraspora malaysiensis TaxID=161358 RepID=UPI00083415E4|nr:cold shock domain-containing protein [Microtetraspora malaysiensis]
MTDSRPHFWAEGVVASWSDEEGFGIVRSGDVPGDVFVHFSMISQRDAGYRSLTSGETVYFTWEAFPQDGCRIRAIEVRRPGAGPDHSRVGESRVGGTQTDDGAYVSRLRIEFDQD